MAKATATTAVLALVVTAYAASVTLSAQTPRVPRGATIFVEPGDMSQAISAAILKQKAPVQLTMDRAKAGYVLTATTKSDKEGTGERIAKVVMLGGFSGNGKSRDTSVVVTDSDGLMLWAYNTRQSDFQRAAEGTAKNLKKHIEGK